MGFVEREPPKGVVLALTLATRKAFHTVRLEAIVATLEAYGFSPPLLQNHLELYILCFLLNHSGRLSHPTLQRPQRNQTGRSALTHPI